MQKTDRSKVVCKDCSPNQILLLPPSLEEMIDLTNPVRVVLWEDAETGALKQSPSTANEYHGTSLTIDPFISLKKSGRFQHDLKICLQSTLNRLPASEQNNCDAISLYSQYQIWY
jgi:hypothetical protein